MYQLEPIQLLLLGLLFVGLSVAAGIAMGRASRKRLYDEAEERLRTRLTRMEALTREQSRMLAQGTVASLALSLPSVVRELNRADLNTRRIPRLILSLAEAIFRPTQVLFYVTRSASGSNAESQELHLILQKGLQDVPENIKTIPFGQGKLGWVAENRLDRLKEDWVNQALTDGAHIPDNHASLEIDIVGPLVHYTREGEQVLGVLSLGSPQVRPRDEKLMFQMVTNLGSLALVNARNVSRLREQANRDGLTGLLNKSSFMEELAVKMLDTGKKAECLSLFIFDIDYFKNYNDTNGHPAGDELLRILAKLVSDSLRPGDSCCRYGGEEFLIAMPDTNGKDAFKVAERIRETIADHRFANQESQPNGNLTISGGVSAYPDSGSNLEELIQTADQALYQSKAEGRNRVTRYRSIGMGGDDEETDHEMVDVPEIETDASVEANTDAEIDKVEEVASGV